MSFFNKKWIWVPISVIMLGLAGGIVASAQAITPVPSDTGKPTWEVHWYVMRESGIYGDKVGLETFPFDFNYDWGEGIVYKGYKDHIGFKAYCELYIPEDGEFYFKVGSNNGFSLLIDGEEALESWKLFVDEEVGYREAETYKFLSRGFHKLELHYYEWGGGAKISFKFSAPNDTLFWTTVRVWQDFLSEIESLKTELTEVKAKLAKKDNQINEMNQKKEMTTAEEIRDAIVEAWANAETAQFDTNSTCNITKKNGEPSEVLLRIILTGTDILDEANQEMKTEAKVRFYLPPEGGDTIDGEMEQYFVPKAIYTKITISGQPTIWTKEDMERDWEEMSPIKQEMELLTSGQVELLGSEEVNGTDCYLLKVVPSIEKLWEQMVQSGWDDIIAEEKVDPQEMIESSSLRMWIAKDSLFLIKDKMEIRMVVNSEAVKLPLEEEEKFEMIVDVKASSTTRNYNQPVLIELPPEAEEAVGISPVGPEL